jgi:tRNA(Ile)-lysidine synthase
LLRPKGVDPLDDARIDALLAPLSNRSLLIAVSGGPDSTALLLIAAEWAARGGKARLAAATVDHGLRPESASEARKVAGLCARLGVSHVTLLWKGPKPSTRLQERAREARYRLLIDHARKIEADAVVTAHHADDQAETVLFRLLRGSGLAGLRGMEAMSQRDGILIARPLLSVAKSALVGFCLARGVPFIEDPSNADPAYARTRLRSLAATLAKDGLDADGFTRLARRAAETEEALERMTAEVEARLGKDGRIDAHALFAAPIAIVQRILARRLAAEGGAGESRIGLEKIEALARALGDALTEGRAHRANVAGAVAKLTAKGVLDFGPEPPRKGGRESAIGSRQSQRRRPKASH